MEGDGPYLLAGSCMGATVALELSHRLAATGQRSALILIDPRVRRPTGLRYTIYLARRRAMRLLTGRTLRRRVRLWRFPSPDPGPVWRALEVARDSYACRPTEAPSALLRSTTYEAQFDLPGWYLRTIYPRIVLDEDVQGDHDHLYQSPSLDALHPALARALERLESELAS